VLHYSARLAILECEFWQVAGNIGRCKDLLLLARAEPDILQVYALFAFPRDVGDSPVEYLTVRTRQFRALTGTAPAPVGVVLHHGPDFEDVLADFPARAARLAFHTVSHVLYRDGHWVLSIICLFRDAPQLLGYVVVDDHRACGWKPVRRLRVVVHAIDHARRDVTRVRALAVARVKALVSVLRQARLLFHFVGQAVCDSIANASTLEVGIVLGRAKEFIEWVAPEKVP
jgi:hypothetical protein